MQWLVSLVLLFSLLAAPYSLAQEIVDKTYCMSAIGYRSGPDDLRQELLLNAKRLAVNELFGEMITSMSRVENFTLTEDMINAYSSGFVRLSGDPVYANGRNFGEVCVTAKAYVTAEDRKKLEPIRISKKRCYSNAEMSTIELKQHTKDLAIITALQEYEPKLKGINKDKLLTLVRKVKFTQAGFIPDTETYCAVFEGVLLPIEAVAVASQRETYIPSIALVETRPTGAITASSTWANDFPRHGPENAKLSSTDSFSNWSAGVNDANQWIQVDLGSEALVRAVGAKGRAKNYAQWVTSYKLSYSLDGIKWTYYQHDGSIVTFKGNSDGNTEIRNDLPAPVLARYVRFHPVTWYGHITMRVEVYGILKE